MKIISLVTLLFLTIQSQASCLEKMEHRKKLFQNQLTGATVVSAPAVVAVPYTMGISILIPAASVGTFATKLIIHSSRLRNLKELVEQAPQCSGKRIERLYHKYLKANVNSTPISIEEMCDLIIKGNETGKLCQNKTSISNRHIVNYIKI